MYPSPDEDGMKQHWWLALALIAAGPVALQAQQLSPPHEPGLADTLVQFARDMVAAVRARDVARTVSFYGRPGEFVHIENGQVVRWRDLEQQMRSFMGSIKENRLEWVGAPRVLVLSRDAAVVFGRHSFSGIDGRGKAIRPHDGEWTGVLQRIGGRWKVVHSHSSDADQETAD
jgi:ketosteroid isomerase-like protein